MVSPQLRHTIKANYRKVQAVHLLEKGLELVSPPHFVHDFSRIIFLMLYSVNRPNFNPWLPLFLEILVSRCIVIIPVPVDDFINFEIKQSFLIKPFSYMIKQLGQKFECLKNKEISIFKGFSIARNWLRHGSRYNIVFMNIFLFSKLFLLI